MTRSQDAPRRPMDSSQWTAVLEALDEVEARVPEGDPFAEVVGRWLVDVRGVVAAARTAAG